MNRAVFLDRDGVLNALVYRAEEGIHDSPYSLAEFRLLPGVAEAIRLIHRLKMLAVVVSNQPGVAKGKCDGAFLEVLSQELQRQLKAQGAWLDGTYYCVHHPEGAVEGLRLTCECRKPRPGLLLKAAQELGVDLQSSYMVGDSAKDMEAASAAGCKGFLVGNRSANAPDALKSHLVARDLLEAVQKIARGEG
ncbi:MAG: HAD family hydrolase [Dehalococcoidia bacterium]